MSGKLTYASLPVEIKKIANDSLGLGFLKTLFNYQNTYHLMIKISDGAFIGFSLYHFEETTTANGLKHTTGVIDCVCVAAPYRKESFGTLLTFGTLKKMSAYKVDRIELMLKTPAMDNRDGEPGVPLIGSEDLLKNLGFRLVKVLSDHYYKSSEKANYDCAFCGNSPDTCKGVLYAIQNDNE